MKLEEMREIMAKFQARFPNTTGLNIRQMKGLLDGTLVKVKVQGTNKFILMTPKEVAPGGKLDRMNAARRAKTKHTR